jgi:hypothetical protein
VRAFSAGALRRLLDVDDRARPACLAVTHHKLAGEAFGQQCSSGITLRISERSTISSPRQITL